jgi:uncharacterized protein (TIGR03435 family)
MRPLFLCLCLAASALAQDAAPLSFDVASVKINRDFRQDDRRTWLIKIDTAPDSLTMNNVNLTMIVAWAYNVQRPQIAGPDWLDAQRYDILAKAGRPASEGELQRMLQTLLAERFKLKVHRETRQMDVTALVLPKNGQHKMKQSQGDGPTSSRQDPALGSVIERIALADLLMEFSRELTTPAVDMTGLTGKFDFTFNVQKYAQAMREQVRAEGKPVSNADAAMMVMRDALEGELGLKFEPRRTAVEMTVIDHVERTPVEN